ncbi:hypothetical protein CONPUDRAFT_162804 [Coniophora puteana RWD-64-598 SS2]|uniref:F-box domain-containing protein n=1 Tax=Coniophora puteana (strain RWD-64-598) TaxID=741705 RepID=A0A5M3N2Y5_CONPW|nr:uncharacterized protein CONPUDRAFT_162804 [Coniophora puteana RWD-64-598 SS2]EIW85647.1 hypothetical protein CONPUDRAFT_162804 [Coniophora puteana RWD-64-598 SS2]
MTIISVFAHFIASLDVKIDDITESPFTPFYKTNYNTSSSIERSQLNDIIGRINGAIDGIDSVIEQLAERKVVLESTKREHSRFRSVVGRIPEDVLSIIFEYSSLAQASGEYGVYKHRSSLSFNFSDTCRRWRTVARGNPKLWNNIFLNASRFSPDTMSPQFSELALRCRLHPVYLLILNSALRRMKNIAQSGILKGLRNTCQGLELHFCDKRGLLPSQLDD